MTRPRQCLRGEASPQGRGQVRGQRGRSPIVLCLCLLAMLSVTLGVARADAVRDCNDASEPAVRIQGCDFVIATEPPLDIRAIALMNRGIGYASQGDYEAALADFNAAVAADPGLLSAIYNRGNVNLDLGDAEAASRDFGTVIRRAPGFSLGWLNRGLARERLGELEGARSDFAKALSIEPSLAAARRGLERLARAAE